MALQILYGLDVLKISAEEAIDLFQRNFEAQVITESKDFSSFLVKGVWNNKDKIDELISACAENWSLARISRVDKSILRIAVFELLNCQDIPPKATLNEAIELGKVYGSENSGAFINGILDALYARFRKEGTEERFS
jgi:N utilization substance protein B